MRKGKKVSGFLLIVCLLLFPVMVWADGEMVVDQAGLFDQAQVQELENRIQELENAWDMDFVVVTTREADGKTSEEYADDYYDYQGYQEDGALYLIDLANGSVWISTKGDMIRYLTDERIDAVIDAGYENLKAKNYADGILQMLDETESFLQTGIPSNQYNYDTETGKVSRYRSITPYEALGAGVLALLCGGGFAVAVLSSYRLKRKTYRYPYESQGKVHFTRREDRFVNRIITHRQLPKNPPPSSGGGGGQSSIHTSSSGSSHGGGGRSL